MLHAQRDVETAIPAHGKVMREISADVAGPATPHSTMPLMTTSAGRAAEGLRADWQTQLATLQSEVGFRYIRFHGLLHDDMGIYGEDVKGHPVYSFEYVDTLFDALLARHIKPFVELGFMPERLASGTQTVFWWKANISPPNDMPKWNGLIHALMAHWIERFGITEVATWYFEVWNEPDLPGFWSGTEKQYFDLYKNTAETVKSVCPACKVGGPASAIRGYEDRWLKFVADSKAPADFLSTHAYGVLGQTFDAEGKPHSSTGDPIDRIRGTREVVNRSATPKIEVHYTEWNSRYTPTHPLHDQYIAAPFILEKLRQATGLVDAMAYWTFTDIFEEDGPRLKPFHGGFGLMTLEGVRKPAYFAYRFLAQLGPDDLQSSDAQSWVTKKPDGSVQALFWDYTPALPPSGVSEEAYDRPERPAADLGSVRLNLRGLRDGRYRMSMYVVGHGQNDSYTAYLRMGSPENLSRIQLKALEQASNGAAARSADVTVKGGRLVEQFGMHENDCVLVLLEPK